MRLEVHVGGVKHIQDVQPGALDTEPVEIKILLIDEERLGKILQEALRLVYLRGGQIYIS